MSFISFRNLYKDVLFDKLKNKFNYTNVHQVPRLEKVVLNMGVGDVVNNSKIIDNVANDLMLIAGQKPVITKARKSIAAFKLRQGMSVGCKVTLRSNMMYYFLERLCFIALPSIKNFRSFSLKNMDKSGNLNFGIKEYMVFPEVNYDSFDKIRGMNVSIITSAKTDVEAVELLKGFHLPFNVK